MMYDIRHIHCIYLYSTLFNPLKKDKKEELSGIGSIAGGGRYDNLVGMFSGSQPIPCVGVSIGVERIFSLILARSKLEDIRASETQVYVCGIGNGTLEERMKICTELWDAGINVNSNQVDSITPTKAEFTYKQKPKLPTQFGVCEKEGIPIAILVGEGEIEGGVVNIKDQKTKGSEQSIVQRHDMIQFVRNMLKEMKEM